jgi:hypothetical protein
MITECEGCGCLELEVHRPRCPVWLKKNRGPFLCRRCENPVRSLVNGLCGLCHYVTWRWGK